MLPKAIIVRARNLPLILDDNRESLSDLDLEDRQRAADGNPHHPWIEQDYPCGEARQPAPGEQRSGTGCNGCDQETRTWNPQFMSMNYALSRLNRVEATL